jgi:hypothetical protein
MYAAALRVLTKGHNLGDWHILGRSQPCALYLVKAQSPGVRVKKGYLECMVNDASRACRSLDMCCCAAAAADDVSHMLGARARAKEVVTPVLSLWVAVRQPSLVSLTPCSSISTLAEVLVNSTAAPD